MITVNEDNKIEINSEKLKSNPGLISLMKTLKRYNIDIGSLGENDTNDLFKCILVIN